MTIKILKIDFRKGKRRECGTCPVALGCLRAAKPLGYTSVIVLPRGARFFWAKPTGGPGRSVWRDLPAAAQVAIRDFDSYSPVEFRSGPVYIPRSDFAPFEFEIEDLPRMA